MPFTPRLHLLRHPGLHLFGEANRLRSKGMRKPNGEEKNAAQTPSEAGATPPFDAPCVTGLLGSLPPRWRGYCARVLGRVRSFGKRTTKEK